MIWFLAIGITGLTVMGVVAWARGSRKAVEEAEKARRERQRLNYEEAALLSRLEAQKKDAGQPPGVG
ncbi:MAG: hypothetical protein AB7P07_09440 [Hyphomonadaceae bacterium]